MASPPRVHCPHCETSITWTPHYPYRPFCSERCRMIDLGHWVNETYTIATNQTDEMVPSEEK